MEVLEAIADLGTAITRPWYTGMECGIADLALVVTLSISSD